MNLKAHIRSEVFLMHKIKLIAIVSTALLVFALFFASILFKACSEDFHQQYINRLQFEQSSAGDKSWLPEVLPQSATNIENWHNLDTNSTFGHFNYDSSEDKEYSQRLIENKYSTEIKSVYIRLASTPEWPECLSGKHSSQEIVNCGYKIYYNGKFVIFINKLNSIAYYCDYKD